MTKEPHSVFYTYTEQYIYIFKYKEHLKGKKNCLKNLNGIILQD